MTALVTVSVLLWTAGCSKDAANDGEETAQSQAGGKYEEFDAGNFTRSTTIDNEWFPLKPGTRFVWEGTTVDEEGDEESRTIAFVVTDLTKEIGGVPSVVCWDRDIVDGELEEAEIAFFAQDDDGAVWLMGEYPEEYEDGVMAAAPCWIHGIKDSRAGIIMPAEPKLDTPSYSQGWAPSVEFTDRGIVYQMGEETTVPFGSFEDVLVIDESNEDEPDAHQLKYYARDVGNVRVGWRGEVTDEETLELASVEQLSPEDLAKAREEALKLEANGFEVSKDVYALTSRSMHGGDVARIGSETLAAEEAVDADDPAASLGTEEFGLSSRELVQAVEKVEALIAQCMSEQGFEYVAADYRTVRRGMTADKSLPGMTEQEFIEAHGFGVSTFYTGLAPQLVEGYSPGKVGLGERNVQIFQNLSPADQVAYNRALFGENTDATFAVALEIEDFSRCGGCTLEAIKQVFKPEQLTATYYNPKDALINQDPRMRAALRQYAERMRSAGYNFTHPDEVENEVRDRLAAITEGGTVSVESMSPEQLEALRQLQEYEREVALVNMRLQEEIFEPVEELIEEELFSREVK